MAALLMWLAALRLVGAEDARAIESRFQLPPGFALRLVASEPDLANPITLCVDEQGTLWVTEAHTYRWGTNGSPVQPPTNPIKRMVPGKSGLGNTRVTVAAEGFPEPVMGVSVRGDKLYATCLNELFVMDIGADGRLRNRRLLVKDAAVPWNPFGMYRVQVGPDDHLWLAIADHPGTIPVTLTGSDGKTLRLAGNSGGLVRCRLDGSGLELISQGLRAPFAFDIDPWGHIWQISNGEGSPNLYLHVIPGLDYGYASHTTSYSWLAGKEPLSPPVRDMGAGANTAALHYFSSQFPPDYQGNVLVANWGSHGSNSNNREIVRYKRSAGGADCTGTAGTDLTEAGKFLTTSDPLFRPTGLVLAPDGGIYLLDWHGRDDENDGTGRIFKITYQGSDVPSPKPIQPGGSLNGLSPEAMVRLLGHSNHEVRERARRELAGAGSRGINALRDVIRGGDSLTAANAIWVLGRIRSIEAIRALPYALEHPDARIRGHALRQLRLTAGQTLAATPVGLQPAYEPLMDSARLAAVTAPGLSDVDGEVRIEAALAQDQETKRTLGLLAALETRLDERLVYQVGMQLGWGTDAESVLSLAQPTNSPGKRRAGLIALDTARHTNPALVDRVRHLDPAAMNELPPAGFSSKVRWLQHRRPDQLAAELARLDRGEITPANRTETLAVLEVLEAVPPGDLPVSFIRRSLGSADPGVQEGALRLVRRTTNATRILLEPTLRVMQSTPSTGVRLEAIFALSAFGGAVGLQDWVGALSDPRPSVSTATLRSMREAGPSPPARQALLQVGTELVAREPGLAEDVRLTATALGIPLDSFKPAEITAGRHPGKPELAAAVLRRLPKASATLGRLGFASPRLGCAVCHSAQPGASPFGPSLSGIGTASQPEYLIESILEPSRVIKTGFQTEVVERIDGETVTGVVEVAGSQLRVRISATEQVSFPVASVKRRITSPISLMPEGLEGTMSEMELSDLVAWLQSLK